jgi:hypothetical protein
MELHVVAGRSRTQAGRPYADSGRPMLIHACHAMPMLCCAMALKSLSEWHGHGMAQGVVWRCMAHVNQTWPHCVNQMGKTQSKPLVAQHGRGTIWTRHGMCELALIQLWLQHMEVEFLRQCS